MAHSHCPLSQAQKSPGSATLHTAPGSQPTMLQSSSAAEPQPGAAQMLPEQQLGSPKQPGRQLRPA
jgi:hypothetical protein